MKNQYQEFLPGDFVYDSSEGEETKYIYIDQYMDGDVLLLNKSDLSDYEKDKSNLKRSRSTGDLDGRDFLLQLLLKNLEEPNPDTFSSLGGSRTIFKPFQFRPLLKYMSSSNNRLVIADEVGLGKTIEAGYIMVEEMFRTPLKRVLIVCPSHLRYKWRWEMNYRFGIPFRVVNGRQVLEGLEGDKSFHYVVSMDSMRNDRIERLKETIFQSANPLQIDRDEIDFLIIDEIHHMIGRSGSTLRREFGMMLSMVSKRCLGLSATPVHLGDEDLKRILEVTRGREIDQESFKMSASFDSLIHQINEELMKSSFGEKEKKRIFDLIDDMISDIEGGSIYEGQDMLDEIKSIKKIIKKGLEKDSTVGGRYEIGKEIDRKRKFYSEINRSRRVDVGEDRIRRTHTEPFIELSQEEILGVSEHDLFFKLDEFFKENFHTVHRLQLSSCLQAMYGLLQNGFEGFNTWQYDGEFVTDYEYEQQLNGTEKQKAVESSLDDEERKRAKELCEDLRKIGFLGDSKLDYMIDKLKDMSERGKIRKAIVFTKWRPTIEYFIKKKSELKEGLDVNRLFFIRGDSPMENRGRVINEFEKKDGFTVLFANDVLSEGLDLVSADCVVNYDLPYNPQKLEQRIGRVDRIGQESEEVHIVNLVVKGSMDQKILERIMEPIEAFERMLGPMGNVLFERHIKGQRIDDLDPIKIKKEKDILEDIKEEKEIVGVNDWLDKEIREMKEDDKTELERRIVIEEFSEVMEGTNVDIEPENEGYRIEGNKKGLSKLLAEIYCSKLDKHDQFNKIRSMIKNLDKLTLEYDGEGEYVSLNHPLFKGMKEIITLKDFQIPYEGKVASIILRGDNQLIDSSELLILTNFHIGFNNGVSKESSIWKYNIDDSTLDEMNGLSIADILQKIEGVGIDFEFKEILENISGLRDLLEGNFEEWKQDEISRYQLDRKLELDDKLNRLEYKRYKLSELSEEKINKKLEQKIDLLENKIDSAKKHLEELEEGVIEPENEDMII